MALSSASFSIISPAASITAAADSTSSTSSYQFKKKPNSPNTLIFSRPLNFLSFRSSPPSRVSALSSGSTNSPTSYDDESPEMFIRSNSISDFMRFKKGLDRGSGELQTALVRYRKRFPWSILSPFLQVDLVSTIHIADKEYFSILQKELETYDCVLYEMVASRESLENRRNPIATRRLKAYRSRGFNILGFIQRQMARILSLDFQLDCLDYQSENWYHADLDFETFKLLQDEKGESLFSFARDMTIKSTKAMLRPSIPEDLGPWRSKLLWASRVLPMPLVGFCIIGSVCNVGSSASEFPELEALSRLDFGAAMKVFLARRLTSEFTQVTADVEEKSVIIGERNRVAVEALKRAMDEGHNKIAILYGGGHMPDLGRRLREDFDLVPSGVEWVTAWSIQNRDVKTSSFPFLKTMAQVSGWPLNRYQTLALLIFSSVLAVDLLFWEIFFGTSVDFVSEIASKFPSIGYPSLPQSAIPNLVLTHKLRPLTLTSPLVSNSTTMEEEPPPPPQLLKFQQQPPVAGEEAALPTPTCKPPLLNRYALACALLASTNSTLLGYDIGVMSGAVLFIRENLNITSTQVEILVGVLNIASLFGSLASGKTSDYMGRRKTIVLAALTFLIGAILMGFAPSYPFLLAGRIVAGIGVGYSLMIAPVYTAELSPTMNRGFLTSLPEVFIVTGILLGYIVNYALSGISSNINWRIMLGLAALPSLIIGSFVLAMPESPRWLVMQGKSDEARKVLIKISNSAQEADLRLKEITDSAAEFLQTGSGISSNTWRGQGVWKELLFKPSKPVRRMLIAAVGINFFMQASGNDAVIYYTPEVFRAAGIHNKRQLFGVNVIMGLSKAAFVLLSAFYLDRFGRRPLLLLGSVGMGLSLFILGIGSKILQHSEIKPSWAVAMCVVAVCAFVSFFSIGLGPITWVYSSEIFPLRLRAQGTGLAISVNRLVSGVVSMTFLTMSSKISFGGMFFVLGGIVVVGTVFFYVVLPETKGKSLEEIQFMFEDKKINELEEKK
ncbi:Polyol transporter 5 [Linum grandiflorum]